MTRSLVKVTNTGNLLKAVPGRLKLRLCCRNETVKISALNMRVEVGGSSDLLKVVCEGEARQTTGLRACRGAAV